MFPLTGRKHGYHLCAYGRCAVCDIQHRLTGERRKEQRRKHGVFNAYNPNERRIFSRQTRDRRG